MPKSERSGTPILLAAVAADMMGFGIVLPLLPFYAEEMGASPFEITLILASFSAAQLVAGPLLGRLSDSIGRRPVMVAGLMASSLSYLLFALAATVPVLLLSRVAAGASGSMAVAQAYSADSSTGNRRAAAMARVGAAAGLGVMIGPAIGGYASRYGLGAAGYFAAILCAANALAALLFLPESPRFRGKSKKSRQPGPPPREIFGAVTSFPLSLLFPTYFLSITCFAAMTSILALFGERRFEMTASDMGIVFTLAGAVTVIVRGGLVGRVVGRLGETRTLRIGCLMLAGSVLAIPLAPSQSWIYVIVPCWALSTAALFPSIQSLMSQFARDHIQGSVMGAGQLAGGSGRVIGPLAAGLMFQAHSPELPFFFASALAAVALLMAFALPPPPADSEVLPGAGSQPAGNVNG